MNGVVGSAHDGADSGNERCGLSDSAEANLESLAEIIPKTEFLELVVELCVLDTVVDGSRHLSELVSHLTVLGVRAHGVGNTAGNLCGRSHDGAESSLEVIPETKLLELVIELSVLDTVVNGSRHLCKLVGHLSVFRVRAHGVGNTASNLGGWSHDGAKTSLEVIPETEFLKLFLGEVSPLGLELVSELLSSWYGFVLPHILHIIHGRSKFVFFPLGNLGSDLVLPGVLGVGDLVSSPLLGFLETLIHVGSSLLEGEELLRFDSVGKHSNN